MIRILALDIALTTGWASDMPSGGDKPCFGSFTVDADKGEAMGRAAFHFERELRGLIQVHNPTDLAYEAPISERAHGPWVAELVLGLCCLVNKLAFELELEAWACEISPVRKHFIGDGRSRKEAKQEVWDRCKLLGWQPQTLDQSDAGAVWCYAHDTIKSAQIKAR